MDKMNLYTKYFTNEAQTEYRLDYSLLIHSIEEGQIFGVAVQKSSEAGIVEEDAVEGLFESRREAESFLFRLAEGMALPVELTALCDDYISEKEFKENLKIVREAS